MPKTLYGIEVYLDGNWFRHTDGLDLKEVEQTVDWLRRSGFTARTYRQKEGT